MIFAKNDVLEMDGSPPVTRRVLAVVQSTSTLWVLDFARSDSWPEPMDLDEAIEAVNSGRWSVTEGREPMHRLNHELRESQRLKRNEDFKVIEFALSLARDEEEIFHRMGRSALVVQAMKNSEKSRPTVKRLFRLWFHGGMSKGGLTPAFDKCGGKGQLRKVTPGVKRGRPVESAEMPEGINIDETMRMQMVQCHDAYYVRERKRSMAGAHRLYLRLFCGEKSWDELGRLEVLSNEECRRLGLPTLQQYVYWIGKLCDPEVAERARLSPRGWKIKRAPHMGTATSEAFGPGARYQIDATILDVYLRSRVDENQLVGRPTLYVVTDVFSRMIVGYYIGLESASWVAAMSALANAASNKVEYCRSIGLEISPDDWPPEGICSVLEGDRGEMLSANCKGMVEGFDIRVENAASYMAYWKQIVESKFFLLPAVWKAYVDGYVETDFRTRGADDYRKEAFLTLNELEKIVALSIICLNNAQEIGGYPRTAEMTRDGVPSVARDLWRWGIANLSGPPRKVNEERFRFALLPRAEATVTTEGILFQKRYYEIPLPHGKGWHRRAQDGRFKVDISYDKRATDVIYLHADCDLGFVPTTLNIRSLKRYATLSGWEAEALDRKDRIASAQGRTQREMMRATAEARIEAIAKTAKNARLTTPGVSKVPEINGMRENRARDLEIDRKAAADAFRPAPAPVQPPQGPPAVQVGNGYSYPTLGDFKKSWLEDGNDE